MHAFRVAVDTETGEVRILQSVQAADAGAVLNPQQCRGQVEGGVAQAIGSALYEEILLDGAGTVLNPQLRNYHIPQLADVPDTEVYFADTYDELGPARRQVDERVAVQPGRPRPGQRDRGRHRRPASADPDDPRRRLACAPAPVSTY